MILHLPLKIITIILTAVITLLLFSCQSAKIKPAADMKFMYEVSEGEETMIAWNFENANLVKVDGYVGTFFPKGSINVKPASSYQFKITAFRGFHDSLVCNVNVDVLALTNETSEIRTGDIVLHDPFEQQSFSESEYINGIISNDISDGPQEMKVIRIMNIEKEKTAYADILLLDKNGNYITGYGRHRNKIIWNATNLCGGITANYSNLDFTELTPGKNPESIDLALLIDNSHFAGIKDKYRSIHSAITGLRAQDNVMISLFNESVTPLVKLMPAESAVLSFNNADFTNEQYGFSAFYDAIINTLPFLSIGKSANKAIIIITSVNDNASVINNHKDIIQSAKDNNISVFVIGIGDAVSGYDLQQMCISTGGKYYLLLPDETDKIQNIISEIIFTFNNCYRVKIPMQNFSRNCIVRNSTIHYVDNHLDLNETITFGNDNNSNSRRKIIAAGFEPESYSIDTSFFRNLDRIALYLQSNPNRKITLTGYGSDEGNIQNVRKYAQMRAQALKDYLARNGISQERMTIMSNINERFFTTTTDKWLENLNRRVEISDTDTMKLFYEIIVDTALSEELAQNSALEWEKRGFKAYYIRSASIAPVSYDIRLWGYDTKYDADKAAAMIKSKFKKNVIID